MTFSFGQIAATGAKIAGLEARACPDPVSFENFAKF
jgi:hypothetical protein